MESKTILSISQRYELKGGSDRYFYSINELLRNSGNRVLEFASGDESINRPDMYQVPPVSLSFNSPVDNIKYFYNWESKKELVKILQNNKDVSLAHLQIYYGHITSSILGVLKEFKVPIIQTLHEYKLTCPVYTHILGDKVCEKCISSGQFQSVKNRCKNNSYFLSLLRYLEFKVSRYLGDVSSVDKFLCVSNFQKELMIRGGIPADKLTVLYNFVDTKNINVSVCPDSYFLYFGRIEELKGIKTLVKAFTKLPTLNLKIAGDGDYLNSLVDLIAKENIKNIEVVGFKTGKALDALINGSRAVMVPSEWYENCSMTVLEAKAYGKPVIASAIGGITEQITDEEDGYLHAAADVDSLVKATEKLCSLSEQEYRQMCLASRNDLNKRYSAEVHRKALFEIYKEHI